jgi:predicted metal-dependent hydrolase
MSPQSLNNNISLDSISYTLVQSKRAKSIQFKICRKRGLQVIVPRRFDQNEIPILLNKHKRWIERTWNRIKPSLILEDNLPEFIQLLSINEIWNISYNSQEINKLKFSIDNQSQVNIAGKIEDKAGVFLLLKRWLHLKAKKHLIDLLSQISIQAGLQYNGATIRDTTTRWGSCSAKKNISLNLKLLFLPSELVRYIIIHELCHTVHLNHSKRFWQLVQKFDPHCHEHRKKLKEASLKVPIWLEK